MSRTHQYDGNRLANRQIGVISFHELWVMAQMP
jgi:hypothetical protein